MKLSRSVSQVYLSLASGFACSLGLAILSRVRLLVSVSVSVSVLVLVSVSIASAIAIAQRQASLTARFLENVPKASRVFEEEI